MAEPAAAVTQRVFSDHFCLTELPSASLRSFKGGSEGKIFWKSKPVTNLWMISVLHKNFPNCYSKRRQDTFWRSTFDEILGTGNKGSLQN